MIDKDSFHENYVDNMQTNQEKMGHQKRFQLGRYLGNEMVSVNLEHFAKLEESGIYFLNEYDRKITFTGVLDTQLVRGFGPKTDSCTFLAICSDVLSLPDLEEDDDINIAAFTSECPLNNNGLPNINIEKLTVAEAYDFLIPKNNLNNFLILFNSKKKSISSAPNFSGARMCFARYNPGKYCNVANDIIHAYVESTLYSYWAGGYENDGDLKRPFEGPWGPSTSRRWNKMHLPGERQLIFQGNFPPAERMMSPSVRECHQKIEMERSEREARLRHLGELDRQQAEFNYRIAELNHRIAELNRQNKPDEIQRELDRLEVESHCGRIWSKHPMCSGNM